MGNINVELNFSRVPQRIHLSDISVSAQVSLAV